MQKWPNRSAAIGPLTPFILMILCPDLAFRGAEKAGYSPAQAILYCVA
jgi:hypothetical protein